MIYRQWKDLFTEHDERSSAWLAKWVGVTTEELNYWDLEPEYGAFVGADGQILAGNHPSGVSLAGSDPQKLHLGSLGSLKSSYPESQLWFLDWGQQTTTWTELFSLWQAWEDEGRILASGPVQVDFDKSGMWKAPAFVLWKAAPEEASLVATVVRTDAPFAAGGGLLARAQALRDAQSEAEPAYAYADGASEEVLPMLPFTLEALRDESHRWPRGVEAFAPRGQATS